jgi:hypothetical protein
LRAVRGPAIGAGSLTCSALVASSLPVMTFVYPPTR